MQGEHGKRDAVNRLWEVYVPHAEGDRLEAFVTEDGVTVDVHDLLDDKPYRTALAEMRYTPDQARQLARRLVELADTAEAAGYGHER